MNRSRSFKGPRSPTAAALLVSRAVAILSAVSPMPAAGALDQASSMREDGIMRFPVFVSVVQGTGYTHS